MPELITLATFPATSTTYKVYSKIKNESGLFGVVSSALVERDVAGGLTISESDGEPNGAIFSGSIIGLLLGALAGPMGMLLGAAIGATTGTIVDSEHDDDEHDIIVRFGANVPAGHNAILLQTDDSHTARLDELIADHGGTVTRQPLSQVVADLEAEHNATEQAAAAARQALWDKRKQQWSSEIGIRIEELKTAFGSIGKANDTSGKEQKK